MAENTKIEWCDHTVNFWWGCEEESPACDHCYARSIAKRTGRQLWGADAPRWHIGTAVDTTLKLNERAKKRGIRYRVFVNSMSDFCEADHGQLVVDHEGRHLVQVLRDGNVAFEAETTEQHESCSRVNLTAMRAMAIDVMEGCEHLDFLLLTKRPENFIENLGRVFRKNVWLGTTGENQEQADKRILELLKCRELSPVLFLSCEPLLGPVCLQPRIIDGQFEHHQGIDCDWVICGGESGHHARPMHLEWARSLRDQCQAAGVPFFMKQLSQADTKGFKNFESFPEDLQVREFPEVAS